MPNTRVIDYTVLVQNQIMTISDVPQDVRDEVAKWVKYFENPIKAEAVAPAEPVEVKDKNE